MPFIELYKFLHIDSDCLFTQTHVPHYLSLSLSLLSCSLCVCVKHTVLLRFIAFAWQREGVKGGRSSAALGSLICSLWLLPNAKRFCLCPLSVCRLLFCCISKINYHLVLFATYTHTQSTHRQRHTWPEQSVLSFGCQMKLLLQLCILCSACWLLLVCLCVPLCIYVCLCARMCLSVCVSLCVCVT